MLHIWNGDTTGIITDKFALRLVFYHMYFGSVLWTSLKLLKHT